MGSVRIQREFDTNQGTRFRINIWDNDWAGSIFTTYEVTGLEIDYERSNDLTEPLQPSMATFTLYGDFLSDFNTFITDLSTAQEDEFKLYIEKYESGAYRMYWAGVIQSDVVEWDNEFTPRAVQIRATDGINRLAEKYFDLSTAYSSTPVDVIKILFDLLSYTATAQFWNGSTMPYIATSPSWYDTQQSLTRVQRMLSSVFIDKTFLIDYSKSDKNNSRSTTDPPLKCKLVLKEILRLFSLRLKLSDGSWHIQQVSRTGNYTQCNFNYLGQYIGQRQQERITIVANITTGGNATVVVTAVGMTGSPITLNVAVTSPDGATEVTTKVKAALNANSNITNYFTISGASNTVVITKKLDEANDGTLNISIADGTCVGITAVPTSTLIDSGVAGTTAVTFAKTENSTTLAVEANGKFGYYPPLKLAKAEIFPSDILNRTIDISSYINTSTLTYTGSTITFGTLYGEAKMYLFLNIYYDVLTWHAIVGSFPKIKVTVTLTAGTYRIKNVDGKATWSTTAADTFIDYITFDAVIDGIPNIFPLEFDEFPAAFVKQTGCTIKIELELQRSAAGVAYPTAAQLNTFFKRAEFTLIDYTVSPPKTGQITYYELENPASSANSIDVDYGEMRISDTGVISSKNVLEVALNEWDGYSTAVVKSNLWNSGHASNQRLIFSILREAIALQKTSIKKYTGRFRSTIYEAHHAITYDSTTWVFMGGRYDFYDDCFDGEWFGIAWDNTIVPAATNKVNDRPGLLPYFKWPNHGKPTDKVKGGDIPSKGTQSDKNLNGAAMTIINTDALPTDLIRAGDVLQLVNPVNGGILGEVTTTADSGAGDTSIAISSFTPTVDLWPGTTVIYDYDDVIGSKEVRATENITLGLSSSNNKKEYILQAQTTDGTLTELTRDGTGGGDVVLIPDDTAAGVVITLVGKVQNSADSLIFTRRCLIINNSGTTALNGAVQTIGIDIASVSLAAAAITVTANNGSDALKVEVTGVAATNINWTAFVEVTIAKYA